MAFCAECGAKLEISDRFCGACGTASQPVAGSEPEATNTVANLSLASLNRWGPMKIAATGIGFAALALLGVQIFGRITSSDLNERTIMATTNAYLENMKQTKKDTCHDFSTVTFGNPLEFFDTYSQFGAGNPKNLHMIEVSAPFDIRARRKLELILAGLRKLGHVETDASGQSVFQFRPGVPMAPNYNITLLKPSIDPYLLQDGSRQGHLSVCFAKYEVATVNNWTEAEQGQANQENFAIVSLKVTLFPEFGQSPEFTEIAGELTQEANEYRMKVNLAKMNDGWQVTGLSPSRN